MTIMNEAPSFDGTQVCKTVDPDLFFPEYPERLPKDATKEQRAQLGKDMRKYNENTAKAKSICGSCEFAEPCLVYALKNDVYGIWGGTTDTERKNFRRRNKLPAPKSMISNIDFWAKEKGAF